MDGPSARLGDNVGEVMDRCRAGTGKCGSIWICRGDVGDISDHLCNFRLGLVGEGRRYSFLVLKWGVVLFLTGAIGHARCESAVDK